MSINIDPFPVIEMVMVSFSEPNGFRTTVKGKKVICKMDGTLAFDTMLRDHSM